MTNANFYGIRSNLTGTGFVKRIIPLLLFLLVSPSFLSAQPGNGLAFDGVDDYVLCGAINPAVMTVEAWVKPASFNDMAIISTLNANILVGFELHLLATGNVCVTMGHGGSCQDIISSSAIPAGKWTHLAFTFDGSTCNIYINDTLSVSGAFSSYFAGSELTNIGFRAVAGLTAVTHYSGVIDELVVWDRVRTVDEIRSDMSYNVTGSETGISAYYNFNQGTSGGTNTGITTLIDSSVNGLNGTLYNFTLTGYTSNWVPGPLLPSLKTLGFFGLNSNSATVCSKVTYLGSFSPFTFGICYNTTGTPAISDNVQSLSLSATGSFSFPLTGLIANTTYYVRAFATNTVGTIYGDELRFTTIKDAPVIAYGSSSYSFPAGATITDLVPVNTGGEVPATIPFNVTTLAGTGSSGSADGTGTSASFHNPEDVETDDDGNIYVADAYNCIVRKITPEGVVTTLAGARRIGISDGTGTEAMFNTPGGLDVDFFGNIYVADFFNHNIRKITSSGVVTTVAGNATSAAGDGYGYVDATGTAARFYRPSALEFDAWGNLYVVDANNVVVRKITSESVVSTFAGSNRMGSADGTGTAASFNFPCGIIRNSSDEMYITDSWNNNIRKMTTNAVVTTFAGNGVAAWVDGDALSASFYGPADVATDALGNVYVSESGNKRIRKISTDGIVTTIAGDGTTGFTDGVGTAASFSRPRGIAVDNFGNLYISDYGNQSIRKMTLYGYSITPALPAGLIFDPATGTISGTPAETSAMTEYTIIAENNGGADTTTISIEVYTTTDIDDGEREELSSARVFPNPCIGLLNVETGTDNDCIYTVSNLSGTIVASGNLEGPKAIVELSSLSEGIYVIKITSGKMTKAFRVVKL